MDDHYEYHVVTIPPSGPQHQLVLDQFSREGWELVDSTPFGILGTVTRLTFRRPSHLGPDPTASGHPGDLGADADDPMDSGNHHDHHYGHDDGCDHPVAIGHQEKQVRFEQSTSSRRVVSEQPSSREIVNKL